VSLAACTRVTEFIGLVPDGGADATADAGCAPDPTPPAIADPGWNCNGNDRCFRDDAVPAPPEPQFDGAPDPSAASRPTLVYPLAGAVLPINLQSVTFQWRIATGDARAYRYRIRLAPASGAPYDFYVPCQPPFVPTTAPQEACTYVMPRRAWAALAAASAGGSVDVTLDASLPLRSQSAPVRLAFAPAAIEGGLTYLSTAIASNRRAIMRHVFGARGVRAIVEPGTATLDPRFDCAGCHSVSRDGATIAFAATYAGNLTVASTRDPARPQIAPPQPPAPDAIAPALSRDGRLVLGRRGDDARVTVREVATGKVVATALAVTLGGLVHFPEWSPDGKEVVATLARSERNPWSPDDGVIVIIPFDGARLGKPRVVVNQPSAEVHLYPSWSPDGQWIVFTSAPPDSMNLRNVNRRLRLVSREGGAILELAGATHGTGTGATSPKFAPARQAGCNVLFIAFSSRLDYGFLRPNSTSPEGGWPQLWLAAIDLRKAAAGEDPSSAPVWLPFQDVNEQNRLPAWSDRVPCDDASACGDGAACEAGRCVPHLE
jgi:hypothetical protein